MHRLVLVAWFGLLMTACGSAASPSGSPTSTGVAVSAGTGCAADHRQGLVFSGALTGHLNCDSGQPICDFVFAGKKTDKDFFAAIHGLAAGRSLLVSFAVAPFSGPGTYRTINLEGGTTITIDGPTHWLGQVGDSIVVATANEQMLTGSFDSTLSAGTSRVRLTGTWVCDRVSSGR